MFPKHTGRDHRLLRANANINMRRKRNNLIKQLGLEIRLAPKEAVKQMRK